MHAKYGNVTQASFPVFSEDGVSPGVQLAFASMLGETAEPQSSEDEEEEEQDSLSYVDDAHDKDYIADKEELQAEEIGKRPRQVGRQQGKKSKAKEMAEDVTVGDVFALEMELNRENKKMMKVRREDGRAWVSFSVLS